MSEILSSGHPLKVAELFEAGEIKWVKGWGNRSSVTCAHGALLCPCPMPGDEMMWSVLLSHRGLTMAWNDLHSSATPVIARLRVLGDDPTSEEMVSVFGPRWETARHVCRVWANAGRQRSAVRAAWDDAYYRSPSYDRVSSAARAAWDARDGHAGSACRDTFDAWDARGLWDAFLAVCAPTPVDGSPWDGAAFDRLVGPWESVFGPLNGV